MNSMRGVLGEVADERGRQNQLWGEQNHPDGTGGLWTERRAKAAQQITDSLAQRGELTWKDILREEFYEALAESDPVKLRAELVQVAAVAVSWIEAIDRRAQKGAA